MASDAVQQIKERLDIVEVLAPYVELKPAGKSLKGKSPFTSEKTPSFYVSPERGMYYCFSTSQGGDIFTFIQAMEGVDFKGALKILAEKAGVELVPEDPQKRDARDTQYAVLEAATTFYEQTLREHKPAIAYLKDRGVTGQTAKVWRIGYAPDEWRAGKEALEAGRFSAEVQRQAGLVKGESGKDPYDVFRDRVMFPINDPSGRVIAFSGRLLSKDSEAPKYVNSPETELFKKSEALYGYDKAKHGIRKMDFSLIVEGQFDVVLAHQAGYSNTVAVSGTALTPHHVALLSRLSNRCVLALDADRAGIAAVKRAAEVMLARGMDVKVARLPDGEDPADIITSDANRFKQLVGQSTPVIEFLLAVLKEQHTDPRAYKLAVRTEVLPYVLLIPNHIDQDHFVGIIAAATDTEKEAIRLELERLREEQARTAASEPAPTEASAPVVAPTESTEPPKRQQVLREYFVAVYTLLPESLQPAVAAAYQSITNHAITDDTVVEASAVSQLLFTLEEQLAALSQIMLQDELVSRLEELRQLTLRSALKDAQTQLQSLEREAEADTSGLLADIKSLQEKRQTDVLTVDIFSD